MCEVLEDGYVKSSDSCYKALVRRASALRAKRQWAAAVVDLEEALKLCPGDGEALKLLEVGICKNTEVSTSAFYV